MKRFRTTGVCNPSIQYMVDISDKVKEAKKLVEDNEYFIINRPRQYGKTTLLFPLKKELLKDYLVISISFEGIGDIAFSDEEKFVKEFINLIDEKLDFIDEDLNEIFRNLILEVSTLPGLSRLISKFIKRLNKEVILIIDEDLKASWNEESMIKAVKLLLLERNTLFDDLIKNIENNSDLKEYILDIIMNGARNTFNTLNPIISLGLMFGYFKNEDNMVVISNRIFSQILYNYFSSLNLAWRRIP